MEATSTAVLEVKSAGAGDDVAAAFEDFMSAFEAFKEANGMQGRFPPFRSMAMCGATDRTGRAGIG